MAKDEFKRSTTAVKLTVEELAAKRGMLPQIIPAAAQRASATPTSGGTRVSIGRFPADKHNPEYWKYAAAKAFCAWPEGMELTEEEFDDAVKRATTGRIG